LSRSRDDPETIPETAAVPLAYERGAISGIVIAVDNDRDVAGDADVAGVTQPSRSAPT
jgi:hypothetical protein